MISKQTRPTGNWLNYTRCCDYSNRWNGEDQNHTYLNPCLKYGLLIYRFRMLAAPWRWPWWLMRTLLLRVLWSPQTALSWTMVQMARSLSGKVNKQSQRQQPQRIIFKYQTALLNATDLGASAYSHEMDHTHETQIVNNHDTQIRPPAIPNC